MKCRFDEIRSLAIFAGGVALAIVGAKMNDDTIKMLGIAAVGGVLGMTAPTERWRDSNSRTRITDAGQEANRTARRDD